MQARRLPGRDLRRRARRAALTFCLGAAVLVPGLALADTITGARYAAPTGRYDHGILGDAIEWGALVLRLKDGTERRFVLPETQVFEDTEPRLADLDGDGVTEIITVESSLTRGARLTVYGPQGRLASTDYIGRKNRWLAPVGAADFTGDGRLEIAMVVTPHLAGRLDLLRYDGTSLIRIATLSGLTNHRIGDPGIAGGVRTCGVHPEMILAQMPWRESTTTTMVAVSLTGDQLNAKPFAEPFTPDNIASAMACDIHPD